MAPSTLSICMRLAIVLGGSGIVIGDPVTSCVQQSKCLTWTVRALPASHDNCGGDCQFEVCAVVDTVQCKGSAQDAIDSVCTTGEEVCGSDVTAVFDEWSMVRLGHNSRVCQVGLGGTTLNFPMNDGAHCTGGLGRVPLADGALVSCAARTASDPSCSPDAIDCVWKVALPACPSGTPRLVWLLTLQGFAVLGAALLARVALRRWGGGPYARADLRPRGAAFAASAEQGADWAPKVLHSSSSQGTLEASSV